ncbi:hypothetical protein Q604_UNBC09636G0002, partial [human gut metagenome]
MSQHAARWPDGAPAQNKRSACEHGTCRTSSRQIPIKHTCAPGQDVVAVPAHDLSRWPGRGKPAQPLRAHGHEWLLLRPLL